MDRYDLWKDTILIMNTDHGFLLSEHDWWENGLFGMHGGHVNVTDGRYVDMRASATEDNAPLYQYTHMPTRMRSPSKPEEMRGMRVHQPFSFTKDCPVMQIDAHGRKRNVHQFGILLFDIDADPAQVQPLNDELSSAV